MLRPPSLGLLTIYTPVSLRMLSQPSLMMLSPEYGIASRHSVTY